MQLACWGLLLPVTAFLAKLQAARRPARGCRLGKSQPLGDACSLVCTYPSDGLFFPGKRESRVGKLVNCDSTDNQLWIVYACVHTPSRVCLTDRRSPCRSAPNQSTGSGLRSLRLLQPWWLSACWPPCRCCGSTGAYCRDVRHMTTAAANLSWTARCRCDGCFASD